ncbi:MAG: hypothetical protein GWO20_19720, partial [Candidatus Korarchaeota archaeon]|nr:hypothetical protein [Candidatus Korarchaeota archaeon]NIU82240.1 hypothetical protein [Candidatus Thorarchaeota archaeon]NIW15581.1 hypothetical protein [Candidatus Thorarchaeota archaeon]
MNQQGKKSVQLLAFLLISQLLFSSTVFPISGVLLNFNRASNSADFSIQSNGKLHVFCIGNSNDKLLGVLNGLQSRVNQVQVKHSKIRDLIEPSPVNIDSSSLVVFTSNWLHERINNPDLHRLLGRVAYSQGKLATIGGRTKVLFEALDKANIHHIAGKNGIKRNPAYFNPPLTAFKLVKP